MSAMMGPVIPARLARCIMPGCPWRWRSGPDRPCATHQDDGRDLARAAEALGIVMTAPPGERQDGDAL
jgi:hypothetical protein